MAWYLFALSRSAVKQEIRRRRARGRASRPGRQKIRLNPVCFIVAPGAPARHMLHRTGIFNASFAGHHALLDSKPYRVNQKMLCAAHFS
jgi:hypothetical protein